MVVTQHLDYLVETDMVELASLLPVDPVDHRDKLAIAMPPAVLLAFSSSIAVLSLIHRFGLGLTLILAKDCTDRLLAGGMACCEVEKLPHRPRFAAFKLVDECFTGHARDERSDHVSVHNIRKLIALLGKAMDVLT
jgi:hypothetical protein